MAQENPPSMSGIKDKVAELAVNCLYEKKKHFNAAARKTDYHTRIGVAAIVLSALVGSTLLLALAEKLPEWIKFVDAFLALAAAVLSSLQTFFGWAKQAEGHNTLGARYLALLNDCKWQMAKYIDGFLPEKDFIKAF